MGIVVTAVFQDPYRNYYLKHYLLVFHFKQEINLEILEKSNPAFHS
jgi:hypothetical protein